MTDGPGRAGLKWFVRMLWAFDASMRGVRRRVGRGGWDLGGACEGCAKCCEQPSIQVGVATWHLPRMRALVLGWHRVVNGFEFVRAERAARLLVFRCTHFDPVTRRCDSYASRPFMCRDYPRGLLDQPWPEFFSGCGYRPLARDRARQLAALDELAPRTAEELRKKLRLE